MKDTGDRVAGDRVHDVLAEWVERRECGKDVPVDVLCRDAPQLASAVSSYIERLKQTEWLFDETAEEPPAAPAKSNDESLRECVLSLAAALSADDLLERLADLRAIPAEELTRLAEQFAGADGDELARVLIERDAVTLFQLRQLCRDRGDDLVMGDYLLLDEIGEGGMGRVYQALHRTMGRVVALKVIHPRATSSHEAAPRFRREVAAAARLEHPQIVRSYDAGESRGRNYLVMEHVEGTDLATLVEREGPLPVGRAVDCILQVARALEYAHGEGIVHRDVKPSNLLLDPAGNVKVLDLGLARIAEAVARDDRQAADSLTASGQVMGTVDYLAPEQALDSRRADQRSDIYSLGCTLYALVHGRPMYDGESLVSRLLAHQSAPVPSLGSGRNDVPRRLEAVFQRMVAKRPRDRFQGMHDVVPALSHVVEPSQREGDLEPALSRRTSRFAGLALIAALASAAAMVPQWMPSGESADWAEPSSSAARAEPSPLVLPQRPKPSAAVVPFAPDEARAHQEVWAAHLGVPVAYENSIGMAFRLIPPGEFTMGTARDETERLAQETPGYADTHRSEAPPRRVRITRPWYLADREVTQEQYRKVTGESPSHFSRTGVGRDRVDGLETRSHPVENVSWRDAVGFCNALADREGRTRHYLVIDGGPGVTDREATGYRLPSEAEWEFACRAGSEGAFGFVGPESLLGDFAVYEGNSGGRTYSVASRRPNAFGLYDMHGNVWERCSDYYDIYDPRSTVDPQGPSAGTLRTLRGGSWDNPPPRCRSAMRTAQASSYISKFTGFRIALPAEAVRDR